MFDNHFKVETHFDWIFTINQNVVFLLTDQNQSSIYGHMASQQMSFFLCVCVCVWVWKSPATEASGSPLNTHPPTLQTSPPINTSGRLVVTVLWCLRACVWEGTRPASIPLLLWCILTATLKDVCVYFCFCLCAHVCVCSVILWWAVISPLRLPSLITKARRWVSVYFLWLRWDLLLLRKRAVTFCHAPAWAQRLAVTKTQKDKRICFWTFYVISWDHCVGAPFWVFYVAVGCLFHILTSMWEFYFGLKPWWSEDAIVLLYSHSFKPLWNTLFKVLNNQLERKKTHIWVSNPKCHW